MWYAAFISLCLLPLSNSEFTPLTVQNPVDFVESFSDRLISAQKELRKAATLPDISDYKQRLFHSELESLRRSKENVTRCVLSLLRMGEDVAQLKPYTLQMLDSWGKLPSGITRGNLKWLGNYYECLDSHAYDFKGKWCMLIIGSPDTAAFGIGPSTSLAVGTCLPNTCSQDDVTELFEPITNLTGIPANAYCPVQPTKYNVVDIIAIIVCSFLGIILIIGTAYDFYLTHKKYDDYNELLLDAEDISLIENANPGVLAQLFLSFSVIKNTKAILDTTQKEGNINVLHGLRFISMTWVILGHSYIFIVQYLDNAKDYAAYYVDHGSFQAIGNATFSVDSFFFLSGLLATYLGMREIARRNGRLNIGMAYLYRYLRLTPAYALCILLSVSLYSKMGDGPLWPATSKGFVTPCQKYWWTNLLYINNVHPASMGEECFGWGWYLANDMQFFLLSPFLLWILYRWVEPGLIILAFGVIGSMISTGVLSSHYKEQPQTVGIGLLCGYILQAFSSNETLGSDVYIGSNMTTTPPPPTPPMPAPPTDPADIFWSDIYAKPWCRMGVYFIGAATGYLLYARKCRLHMNKAVAAVMWMLTIITGVCVVYGLTQSVTGVQPLTVNAAAFYNAVSRPLWAACLAWLVIACSSGYGGPINTFLSWKLFIPLSRLTYCAYLVHPLVIFWVYGSQETQFHFSVTLVSLYFVGFVALSYTVALAVSLVIEMPIIGLLKILVKGERKPAKDPLEERTLINAHVKGLKYGTESNA